MSASSILLIYLVFFGVEILFEHTLTWLNIKHIQKNRGAVPAAFCAFLNVEEYDKSVSYSLTKNRFSMVSGTYSAALVLTLVVAGFLGNIDTALSATSLSMGLQGLFFVGIVAGIFLLLSQPESIYSQFVIEQRHGFNRMTAKTFILDQLKGLLVTIILGGPILLGLFWFVGAAGPLWWLFAFGALALFQLALLILYPLVIAPLFNKFTPLEEGPLREGIERLAKKLNFGTKGICVMDGSKRSRHSNAYFTGFGGAKRIVLYDTLIEQLEIEQILAVLAHEIGHQKKKHIVRRLVVSLFLFLGLLFLLDLLLESSVLFTAFGFERNTTHGLLVILSFCSGPFTFMFTPLFTAWSRRHEYQADKFAVDSVGRSDTLRDALLIIGRDNLANFTPHPLYSFFHYAHPTLAERIAALS